MYPIADKRPVTRSFHGREFVDNYEWLREKEAPEVREYLEAENAYTAEQTAQLSTLSENIFQELKGRIKETDMSVPVRQGNYWYYSRTEEGKSYGTSCRLPVREGDDAWIPPVIEEQAPEGEEVLLDVNEMAAGHDFFSLGASTVTLSGNLLAYSVDTAGDERFTLRIKDLRSGEVLPDIIEGISYGATWAGEDYVFYQRVDDAWRPDSVWRHKVGTPVDEDVLVFHEPDEHFWVGVGTTRSEKYLMIAVGSKITSETWVLPLDDPTGEFVCLLPRQDGVEYDVDHAVIDGKDHWLVTHNATGPNFEVGIAEVGAFDSLAELQVLVPHRADVRIEGIDPFAGHLVLGYRRGGIGRLALMSLANGLGSFVEMEFSEELYSVGGGGNPEWDTPVYRYSYSSFTEPGSVNLLDVATGDRTLLKQQEVLGGYQASDYVARREWARAEDGTRIPISLVHRADLDLSQPQPVILYGYGSYESSFDPSFSNLWVSAYDRGVIFAVAHVRGGGEMGRLWYDNGKLLSKKNTFTDFIAVADHLIDTKVTTPEMMVAEGGSAGGLLMGAVANMGGDRFVGINAKVPFVDPLTSMLMPELPLTVVEWDEWGDPFHDPEVYDYMASYAPYENVSAKRYPDILAVTSLNDTRVLYVEPAKWIARLRDVATGGEFLLKTEMAAGHGGVSGRYERWRQSAFELAWSLNKAAGMLA
ncbi:S9 family peptidase [Corynebacterium epidermidicanis]|uniref:Protease II n=1 Tax=Corynebacterium epidermidicanis TaxID=1050174 RepID=A0A0G3GYI8_9CORY|nr:S9 family peptidase [Corynebacterium epidermidicanis]AKK03927.1 protease II [Corynebacterium epidermidicanis]